MSGQQLAVRLLDWYDRSRRELPWRRDKDPYRIWVSEIMLQQTRVEAVIPYYHRFLRRFPTMEALAAANEDDLLETWQGLGYYSRARRLQQGVREVVAHYGGRTPANREELLRLPGVGEYTAGAILSIAHEQPEPAIDGNVSRVISRLLHIDEPMEKAHCRAKAAETVKSMFAGTFRCGDITQALMELGALVCIPGNPRCGECPWQNECLARASGDQHLLPIKAGKKPPRRVRVCAGILLVNGKVLAVRRPAGGLLGGMWEFPSAECAPDDSAQSCQTALADKFAELGQTVAVRQEWRGLTHVFSHREWLLQTYFCAASQASLTLPASAIWLTRADLARIVWAGPHRKISAWLGEEPAGIWERGFDSKCQ